MPGDPADDAQVAQVHATFRWLKNSAEDLLGRAANLAPLEEGTLRGSFAIAYIVNGARFEGAGAYAAALAAALAAVRIGALRQVYAEVSANTVYAARQHEETEWHHPLSGQAKYLEAPFRERLSTYMRALELEQRLASAS